MILTTVCSKWKSDLWYLTYAFTLCFKQEKDLKYLEEKSEQKEPREEEASQPFTMNIELNFVWLVLVGLSFGTRMWQLTTPKHVM